MVGRTVHRLIVGGVLAVLGAAAGILGATAAHAEGPNLITISGDGLAEPLEVGAEEQPDLFADLYSEVDWLVGRPSQGGKPDDEDTLGPRYVLTVHIDGEARHRFNLYPLAEGGPRAHRPSKQPGDRKTSAGWFYGRLSMPETLAAAGAPIYGEADTGGVGGGASAPDSSAPPTHSAIAKVVDEWWASVRIVGVVTVVLMLGVAAAAFAIRRTV